VPSIPADLALRSGEFTGRDWVFDAIDAWLTAGGERRFLLLGDAGTGKSAIAARLVEISRGEVVLAYQRLTKAFLSAAHFCRAREDQTIDPRRALEHISLQLAARYRRFGEALEQEAQRPGIALTITGTAVTQAAVQAEVSGVRIGSLDVGGLSARETFDRLLRRPLEVLCVDRQEPVVILIDGLDEALSYDGRTTLVEVLRTATDASTELPAQVRFLFTSRVDPRATNRVADRTLDLLADAPSGTHDVREYADRRLIATPLSSDDRRVVASKVAAAGQGNFLYARYVVEEVLAAPAMLLDPTALSLPAGLDGHYREFLERELASNDQRWARFRQLLTLLAVARGEGLNAVELAGASDLRRSEVDEALGVLSQYLTSTTSGRFRLYHQSFRDFLFTNRRYRLYAVEGNHALARFFVDEYGDHWVTAGVGDDSRDYGLAHSPAHLAEAVRLAELRSERRLLGEELCNLLTGFDFLEAKTARLGLDALLDDFGLAPDSMEHVSSLEPWVQVLDREGHSLRGVDLDERPCWFAQQCRNRALRLGAGSVLNSANQRLAQLDCRFLALCWHSSSESSELARTLAGHDGPVSAVAITLDGRRIISAGDRTVRVWSSGTGEELHSFVAHGDLVTNLAVTPDGSRVLIASTDVGGSAGDTLSVWDVDRSVTLDLVKASPGRINDVAVTPDGARGLAAIDDGIHVWDLTSGEEVAVLTGHTSAVLALSLTADGAGLVSGGGDGMVWLWSLPDGRSVRTFGRHGSSVVAVASTRDNQKVISGGTDGVKIWDVVSGEVISSLTDDEFGSSAIHVLGDGNRILSHNVSHIDVIDRDTGRRLGSLAGHTALIFAVSVAGDGKHAASVSRDFTVRLWDLDTYGEIAILSGHTDEVTCVAIRHDAQVVVSGASDTTLRVWDVGRGPIPRGGVRAPDGPVRALAIAPDGSIAVSGADNGAVRVWDVMSGRELHGFTAHKARVRAVALVPDATQVISASDDCTARCWSLETGEPVQVLRGHNGWVSSLALMPCGDQVATAAWDGTARLWDLSSGEMLHVLGPHPNFVASVLGSADGQYVITSSDNFVYVWEADSGTKIHSLLHSERVWDVVLSRQEGQAIAACHDGTIRIWNLIDGNEIDCLEGPKFPIRSLAVAEDGAIVLAGADDQTVRVWDLRRGRLLHVLRGHTATVNCIAVCGGSCRAISGGFDATVHVWDVSDGTEIATAGTRGWVHDLVMASHTAFLVASGDDVSCFTIA
jgi:WD40 repeat protein